MTLKDIDIKPSYETLEVDPVGDFYIPALRESCGYDRIAGFFSSSSLALAARGIAGLISNGGHMRLIVSPNLNAEDLQAIKESEEDPVKYIENSMMNELSGLEHGLEADHVRALGWMLAQGMLEMRIACVVDEDEESTGALFHQKVGVLRDAEGNVLSFSGSVNETAAGWLYNAEEFKVFRGWVPGEDKYLATDIKKFDEFWDGSRKHVKVYKPSEALRAELIKLGEGFNVERVAVSRYKKEQRKKKVKEMIPLFFYQREAVDCWDDHGRRLLFEMATGTGKTRTAIACVNLVKETEDQVICIVAAPEVTLARQWEGEFDKLGVGFDERVYADSSSGGKSKWMPAIERYVSRMSIGRCRTLLVMTTHDTACSCEFTALFDKVRPRVRICFVGDEVHGLGSRVRRNALLERYDYRVGLSATPSRWYDEGGTQLLREYFGGDSYVFSIRDAQETINPLTGETFLTPYTYRIEFLALDSWEKEQYLALTDRIAKLSQSDDPDQNDLRDRLLMKRADITKNAAAKIPLFRKLVQSEGMDKTLVFVSPQQIDEVCSILAESRVSAHPFTMRQGTKKSREFGGLSEREHIIKCFKEGSYQTLVAISCLDEGIDIPSAEKGILLSSSTNPREYIQRVGRVIRRFPGKRRAEIVDFVVEPDLSQICDPETRRMEARLFAKELQRVKEMAGNAENSTDVLFQINERLEKLYGLQ